MITSLLVILFQLSFVILPKSSFGVTSWNTFLVGIGGHDYEINYLLTNATIKSMSIDEATRSLIITINATDHGTLTIELPRNIIDSSQNNIDKPYLVLISDTGNDDGGNAVFHKELYTVPNSRVLEISFTNSTSQIQIRGTSVVPEFMSPLSIIVFLSAALATVIGMRQFMLSPPADNA